MSNKTKIALDCEFEQPNRYTEITDSFAKEPTLIQIGWCVFDVDTGQILKRQQYEIFYGKPLSSFIKKLTGITDEQVNEGEFLDDVYKRIVADREEFQTSRIICQWGHGDIERIKTDLATDYNEEWEFGQSGLNVKHLFMTYTESNGLNRHAGLSKAVNRLGLNWLGRGKHQALVDAINTANVYTFIYNKMGSIPDVSSCFTETS